MSTFFNIKNRNLRLVLADHVTTSAFSPESPLMRGRGLKQTNEL